MIQDIIQIALVTPDEDIKVQVQGWFADILVKVSVNHFHSVEQLISSISVTPVDLIFVSSIGDISETLTLWNTLKEKIGFYEIPKYFISTEELTLDIQKKIEQLGCMGMIELPIRENHIKIILKTILADLHNKTNISYYFEQYVNLVTQMPQGMAVHEIICDANGVPVDYRFLSVNESYEHITSLKAVNLIGRTIKEVLPNVEQSWIDVFGQVALTGIPCEYENYVASLDRYFKTAVYSPKQNHFITIVEDITDRVNMTKKLHIDNQRFSRIMESTADIIFEFDIDSRYVSVFGKGIKKMKQTPEMFVGKTPIELYGNDGIYKDKYYKRCLQGVEIVYEWSHQDDTQTIYFESVIAPIYDENNTIIGGVGISRDITEQKKKTSEIEYLSTHDYLTGLYNRRYFVHSMKQLDIPTSYPLGLMMIDVNGLKILNDAYGHHIGDLALIKIADILNQFFRNQDVVARIGGDEFAIILPDTSNEDMEHMKNKLQKLISTMTVENVPLSLAIGYETIKDENIPLEEVMRQAENFMYRNKLSASKSVRNSSIKAILKTLTDKYGEEKVHSTKVSQYCIKIGEALQIKSDDLKELELAGLFHDIGKISIPDRILDKPGKLTNEEYDIIKTHTENGYQILKAADEYSDLAIHALHHHEKWDGTGYPKGLKEKDIPLFSRIIGVADAFEAMTSNRSYRAKLDKDIAIDEIKRCSGTQFDPMIAKVFIEKVLGAKW